MIDRQRASPGRHHRAFQVAELLGVQLNRQVVLPRGVEHPRHLLRRKADALAKGVHRIGKIFGRHFGQDSPANQVDVLLRVAGVFARHRVRAQKSGDHIHGQPVAKRTGHAQHFQFIFHIEAVARLNFHRGHALIHQPPQPRRGLRIQIIGAGGAGRRHRGRDAAT